VRGSFEFLVILMIGLMQKGEYDMALKEGEVYRCADNECGCEIKVTKGAAPGKGGDLLPRCCCGKEMTKVQ